MTLGCPIMAMLKKDREREMKCEKGEQENHRNTHNQIKNIITTNDPSSHESTAFYPLGRKVVQGRRQEVDADHRLSSGTRRSAHKICSSKRGGMRH